MKRLAMLVFLLLLLLLIPFGFGIADDDITDVTVVKASQEDADAVDIGALPVPHFVDGRIKLIQEDTADKIAAVIEEIDQLNDRSLESELQKKIEKIKLDALIARHKITMEIAEEQEDYDLANVLYNEIYRLENPDEPISFIPSEQEAYVEEMKKEGE